MGVVGRQAPVVADHGQVEQPGAVAGEVEVDDAGGGRRGEQHVVAEAVGMDGRGGQILPFGRGHPGLLGSQLVFGQRQLGGRKLRTQFLDGLGPPARAAHVGRGWSEVGGRQVHAGQQRAHGLTVFRCGVHDRLAGQPRDQRGGLAVEHAEQPPLAVGQRGRAGNAAAGQMLHQFQVEGQLLDRQPLDQGEDPAALGRVNEVVGVLDARGDGFDSQQLAGIVLGQPVLELLIGDDGEDGHGADPGVG